MEFYHNSQKTEYRNPVGAVPAGTHVTLSLQVKGADPFVSCMLNLWSESTGDVRLPMSRGENREGICCFSITAVIAKQPSLCWYYFIVIDGDGRQTFYGNGEQRLGGAGQTCGHVPPAYQITVFKPASVPFWYKNSVVYQIFPDRFARDAGWLKRQEAADRGSGRKGPCRIIQQDWNDTPYYTRNTRGEVTRWPFFGGSLQGIRDHLLYLKSMGAGAIYLNPIFTAASNHKYDTADYMEVDPSFGTQEDFQALCRDAKRLGIRLILDGVFNHTGADSKYFNRFGNYPDKGACQGAASPYYGWYQFTHFPDSYECWWGVSDLPSVHETEPSYQAFIHGKEDSVIRHWLRAGASGWRLDVADELPDSFIADIRKAIRETDADGVLIGEVWEDASNKVSYGQRRRYLLGDELDSVMNYPLRDLLTNFILDRISAEQAVRILKSLAENYPSENFYAALNLIGSHDRPRILTLLGNAPEDPPDAEKETYRLTADPYNLSKQRLKLLSLLQFVLPGVPSVYYGDEAGVQGYADPYNRGTYPWGREDQELLAHYRMLAALRKQYAFLTDGDFRFSWEGEHVFICERISRNGEERLLLLVNRRLSAGASFQLELPDKTEYVLELLESVEKKSESGILPIELPALSSALLYCKKTPPRRLAMDRCGGVLCHVSSLSSGRMDDAAETFIDFLSDCGQKLWQVLPLNPTDEEGNSPYSSPAVFAGNPGLCDPSGEIDKEAYRKFCREESYWLDDYALYTMLKEKFRGLPWQQWTLPERNRKNLEQWKDAAGDELEQIRQEQFRFWSRWDKLKAYANENGISIIGDLPLYVGADSADTWSHPDIFLLDEDGLPLAGSGVPPDYFSEDGQNWGNPLYDWDALKKDGYDWWEQRIRRAMNHFDYIRLDHFRSFSAFYAIPRGETPKDGYWLPGAGKDFFETLTEKLGPLPFLAEDLGMLDPQVHNLLKLCGYPGMLVYQFSAEEIKRLRGEAAASKILYTGTHDNQTLAGWCKDKGLSSGKSDAILEELYGNEAPWVIVPLQDLLGLGDESRMNTPGRARGNWAWRAEASQLTPKLAEKIKRRMSDCGR